MVAGAWLFDRKQGTPALVLTAVGIAVGMLALFAAAPLYGLIPTQLALIGSLVIATGAAADRDPGRTPWWSRRSVCWRRPPPRRSWAARSRSLRSFLLGATLVGTSLIATYRPWTWLPPLAFATTAPQLAFWLVDGPELPIALCRDRRRTGSSTSSAPSGMRSVARARSSTSGIRVARGRPRPCSRSGSSREVLASDTTAARLAADIVLAIGFAVVAALFARRSGLNDAMFSLLAAIAVGVVVIAVALELGGVARLLVLGVHRARARAGWRFGPAVATRRSGASSWAGSSLLRHRPVHLPGVVVRRPCRSMARPFRSRHRRAIAVLVIAAAWRRSRPGTYALLDRRRVASAQSPRTSRRSCSRSVGALGATRARQLCRAVRAAWASAVVLAWSGSRGRGVRRRAAGRAEPERAGRPATRVVPSLVALALVGGPRDRRAAEPARPSTRTLASAIVPVVNEATVGLLAIAAALVIGVALIPTSRSARSGTWLGTPAAWT